MASSLSDGRVNVRIEDGVEYVRACTSEMYDLVIIDSDDPEGPGEGLFTEEFYYEIYRLLKPDGIMVTQSESPRFNQHIFSDIYNCYKSIYGKSNVYCYLMYLPSFPSGMWSFSFSSKNGNSPLLELNKEKIDTFCNKHNLKYYSFNMHQSAFSLPKFVQDILQ